MKQEPCLVAGSWRAREDGWQVRHPYDNHLVASVARASPADVEDAILRAEEGAEQMRRIPRHERGRILREVSDRLERESKAWAELITLESGKPIRSAEHEVHRAVITFRVAAEEALRFGAEYVPLDTAPGARGDLGLMVQEPLGVIAAITPFNSPLNLVAHKVAPAIASGNAILLKPALQAPITALRLGRVLLDAGLPEDGMSILTCSDADAAPLVEDERIRGLTFTGSQIGWELKARAVRKKVTLEMGGNGGIILAEDADMDAALDVAVLGAFGSSGQRCIAIRRTLVHEGVAAAFTEEMIARTAALKAGDPRDPGTDVGPLVNRAAAERAEQWLDEAVAGGARVLVGGTRNGPVVAPTILADVPDEARIWCDELFAPVTSIRTFVDFDDAIDQMNAGSYGLQVGVFTKSMSTAHHAFHRLRFGAVLVNEGPGYRAEHMPYGGTKASGMGREGIRYAMEAMTEPKMLIVTVGGSGVEA